MTIIAFEGIDGAGKSTQIKRLAAWLTAHALKVCITCEPTHGEHGKRIRSAEPRLSSTDERAEFVADRQEHCASCIGPAIDNGEIVLTDRYYYSSMAYQGSRIALERHAANDEQITAVIDEIRRENEAFAPQADILVLFNLSPEAAMQRIEHNRASADAFETLDNLARVAHAFDIVKQRVRETSKTHIVCLNAEKTPDEIEHHLIAEVASFLNITDATT